MEDLYSRIERLCQDKGVNVTAMCKESGASRSSLTDLKMGRKQSLSSETLSKIASYFHITVDYLLSGTEDSSPSTDILDEIDIAFYGDYKALDDEQKEILRDMARTMRRRREEKGKK